MKIKNYIASVNSILISFCNEISINCSKVVQKSFFLLKNELEALDIVASYSTILVTFDILNDSYYTIKEKIEKILKNIDKVELKTDSKIVEIPAFYDVSVGLDLDRVAKFNSLNIQEVIKIHSKKIYFIYTIGFLPGFAYMGDVDKKISTPRLDKPRANVKKGSIAIANRQCAIYPKDSIGGWNILAKTPIKLLDNSSVSLLKIGQRVKFIPINKDEFLKLGGTI
jgi:KipI family sensor histidine kinase inhibitor